MRTEPLVSVFLPYYNDRKFLRESIESVLNNSYENIELILLNHATTDDCRDIAHSYNDLRIKHIDMDINYGAGGGVLFKKMLDVASGKYIKTLCADDILRPNGIKILVDYMENHPEKDFAFGNVEYIDENANDLNDNWFNARPRFSIDNDEIKLIELYYQGFSTLPYIGSITKKECLANIQINKTYTLMFDMSLWLNLLCKDCKIGFVDEIIANYRIHDAQVSGVNNEKNIYHRSYYETADFWEILFEIEDIELVKKLFPNNKHISRLTEKQDIPFIIATSLFYSKQPYAFVVLDKMINDELYSKHLLKTFNFGVKEFRDLYKYVPPQNSDLKNESLKSHIYHKAPKNLSVLQLLFLLARVLLNFINPVKIIKKFRKKKKKKYSL